VDDLVEAAGGLADEADTDDINLAAPLIDGSTLTVPQRLPAGVEGDRMVIRKGTAARDVNPPGYTISGWQAGSAVQSTATAGPAQASKAGARNAPQQGAGLIDLNRATAEQLENLPGIGAKLAQQIIAYRQEHPFHSVDDLDNVPGIGPKKLGAIRPFVTVGP
jgi:competence protein ComEA